MKNLAKILCAVAILFAVACSKEGATGPQGPAGTNGTNGTDGNANVTVYNFGSKTFTGSTTYVIPNLLQADVDNGIILAYYNPSTEAATAWYACPGFGSTGTYNTRYFFYQTSTTPSTYTMGVRLLNADGTNYASSVTFTKFKIIIAPAGTIVNLRTKKPLAEMSYEEVCKILNIKEDR